MTMVPFPSIFKQQHYDGDGGGGGSFGRLKSRIAAEDQYDYDEPCSLACVGSDLVGHNHMEEDESRTTSSLNEPGTSSKAGDGDLHLEPEEAREEGNWLQLGIGGGGCGRTTPKLQDPLQPNQTRGPGLLLLDLKPPGSSTSSAGAQQQYMVDHKTLDPILLNMSNEFRPPRPPTTPTTTPFLLQYQQPEGVWGYNRPNPNYAPWIPSSPSSSSSSILPVPYYGRLFQLPAVDVAGPSSSSDNLRVIEAPPRPHSGVWFVLQASQNQAKEPFLPQIPKTFLRIKDGRMTVLLLMKYLVKK
ncbi:hypothetical protein NE237_020761 [Protea cynaroides]|uniref:Uncharacterized protein n=1 Tax=Protea cynaroides TaxID=273540 RepID=A0A9Q0H917_9MAGN|nr:hypothetical protein NE237_020761 [Protea cynaroides]